MIVTKKSDYQIDDPFSFQIDIEFMDLILLSKVFLMDWNYEFE
jgi:hypothetical protein